MSDTLTIRVQGTPGQFSAFENRCEVTELMLASTLCSRFQIEPTQENLGIVASWMSTARSMGIANHLTSGIKFEVDHGRVDGASAKRLSPGVELITAERMRQIHELHHEADVDDAYVNGELAAAAATYLEAARIQLMFGDAPNEEQQKSIARQIDVVVEKSWPWERQWFRLSADPKRNQVKAAALIAADVDRGYRALKRLRDNQEAK